MSTNILLPKNSSNKLWLPAHARNSNNSRKFLPWRCRLMIQLNEAGDKASALYYARAGDPHKAIVVSASWWKTWEKDGCGLKHSKWPDVLDTCYAECIDENDWNNAWADAKKYNMEFRSVEDTEEPGYPMLFTVLGRTDV